MTVHALATFTRRTILWLAFVAAASWASPAYAEQIALSGTHSKDEVNKACDGVGGIHLSGANGEGYGCYNPSNGVMVGCSNNGACTGYIPSQPRMAKNSKIPDFLDLKGASREGSPAQGNGQRGDTSPFSDKQQP